MTDVTPPTGILDCTVNLTPEQAQERLRHNRKRIVAVLPSLPYATDMKRQVREAFPDIAPRQTNDIVGREMWLKNDHLNALVTGECRYNFDGSEAELTEEDREQAREELAERRERMIANRRQKRTSKRSTPKKPVIARPDTPAHTQQEPVQPAGAIHPTRRRVLSLKRGAA